MKIPRIKITVSHNFQWFLVGTVATVAYVSLALLDANYWTIFSILPFIPYSFWRLVTGPPQLRRSRERNNQ